MTINQPRSPTLRSIALSVLFLATGTANSTPVNQEKTMTANYKQQVVDLLKSIETGDPKPVAHINPNKYIQHNLAIGDSLAGFGTVLQKLPKGSARVNTVRVFQDGNFVFTRTDYYFFGLKVGFDIFRFENSKIVEHWDNLQEKAATANPSGRTMLDGPAQVTDLDQTGLNKTLVRAFVDDILVNGDMNKLGRYFEGDDYIQHNPQIADNLSGLSAALQDMAKKGVTMKYDRIHKVLGEGNFVLGVCRT